MSRKKARAWGAAAVVKARLALVLRRHAGRLHVGCGTLPIDGWCNVDIQDLPGVDIVMDVNRDFTFRGARLVFCEHFLEHLRLDDGIRFIYRCRDALRADGVLRITTPNLDWVFVTHYDPQEPSAERRIESAIMLNRAFHGWGHQFVYNDEVLKYILRSAGFDPIRQCKRGDSLHEELRGLERHVRYDSTEVHPDVLVFEAVKPRQSRNATPLEEILRQADDFFVKYLDWRITSEDQG